MEGQGANRGRGSRSDADCGMAWAGIRWGGWKNTTEMH